MTGLRHGGGAAQTGGPTGRPSPPPCARAGAPSRRSGQAAEQLLLSLVLVGVATLVLMNVLLYVTVVRPVSIFAVQADDISKGQLDVPELPVRGRDEIATLAAAFNRMHRSVTAAMQMLEVAEEAPEPATISRTKSRGSTAP